VSEKFAEKFKYKIHANRELIALGLANFVGSFFSAYPVTGSFSRTAVNANAGAKTPLSGSRYDFYQNKGFFSHLF